MTEWAALIIIVTGFAVLGWRLARGERGVVALGERIVDIFAEMKAELVLINAVTDEIASGIDTLIAKQAASAGKVLTEAEAMEVLDGLRSVAASLCDAASKYTPAG
jgi:hypothetical protein